jgi:teichuronic acid biosynthesis glycosyltransferase TuaC
MRALVISNMRPDDAHPERGRFVRDQVQALRELSDVEVDLWEFPPGASALAGATRRSLRQIGRRFEIVHAHFSLSALPALCLRGDVHGLTLHGTDVRHPRTRLVTEAVLPRMDLIVAVSRALADELPAAAQARAEVIPCGVDLRRFRPIPRAEARAELGLPSESPYLLFPADPARPEKRFQLAEQLAKRAGVPLLTLGGVPPERVPLYVNAANAVLITSEAEGFGLAALEALSCDVPVLATDVGAHAELLAGVEGTLCARFEVETWSELLKRHTACENPRISGRPRAAEHSAQRMAARLAQVWRALLSGGGRSASS